jgi:two-component system, OmpR family, sensor kinase
MRWPSTLRWRLTAWYTALLGAPLIALAVGFYVLFAHTLMQRTDRFIGDALTAFSRELIAERRAALTAKQAIQSTVEEVRFRDLHIAVLDSMGATIAMTPLPARQGPYRVLSRVVTLGPEAFRLTGSYSIADDAEVLEWLRGVLLVLVPLLILAAATGGYFLAGRGLSPVAAMASHAAEISATNLKERLPVSGGGELAGLARVINDLLDRLEASFEQQRRFVSEASHELRTPTAILRTEADVTLAQEHRTPAEYRASMLTIRDAARRLTRIVDDLFVLARADSENVAARREDLYLEELVHGAVQAVRSLADARHVHVELGNAIEAPFAGDPHLLDRLLLNLLDNAIKHSPEHGRVTVEMARVDHQYEIRVADAGKGIPAVDQQRIFERFVRLGPNQQGEDAEQEGAGLGLAIARRIANAHGGSVDLLESRPGRTVFRVRLPAR